MQEKFRYLPSTFSFRFQIKAVFSSFNYLFLIGAGPYTGELLINIFQNYFFSQETSRQL